MSYYSRRQWRHNSDVTIKWRMKVGAVKAAHGSHCYRDWISPSVRRHNGGFIQRCFYSYQQVLFIILFIPYITDDKAAVLFTQCNKALTTPLMTQHDDATRRRQRYSTMTRTMTSHHDDDNTVQRRRWRQRQGTMTTTWVRLCLTQSLVFIHDHPRNSKHHIRNLTFLTFYK